MVVPNLMKNNEESTTAPMDDFSKGRNRPACMVGNVVYLINQGSHFLIVYEWQTFGQCPVYHVCFKF